MPIAESQHADLLAALESHGWKWREEFIHAPHGTMWLLGAAPWVGDLAEFHERMCGRLRRNEQAAAEYDNPQDHRNRVEDTSSLVEALAALIADGANDGSSTAAGALKK